MEKEDSDSEASDVGMTDTQKAAHHKYLDGLMEPKPPQTETAKRKPDMTGDHSSMKRLYREPKPPQTETAKRKPDMTGDSTPP